MIRMIKINSRPKFSGRDIRVRRNVPYFSKIRNTVSLEDTLFQDQWKESWPRWQPELIVEEVTDLNANPLVDILFKAGSEDKPQLLFYD